MINDEFLENLSRGIEFEYGPINVIDAYERLNSALLNGDPESVTSAAIDALHIVADDWRLSRVLAEVHRVWDAADDQARDLYLNDENRDVVIGLEHRVLQRAGLSPSASTSLAMSLEDAGTENVQPLEATTVSAAAAALAEELTQERIRQDIRDLRFGRLLRRIGKAVHVVGGSALMLADVGASVAVIIANPLTVIPASGLAVASLGGGSALIRKGIRI